MTSLKKWVCVPVAVLGLGLLSAGCSESPDTSSSLLKNTDGSTTPIQGSTSGSGQQFYEDMNKAAAAAAPNSKGTTPNK